jgi:hypothetical protein
MHAKVVQGKKMSVVREKWPLRRAGRDQIAACGRQAQSERDDHARIFTRERMESAE